MSVTLPYIPEKYEQQPFVTALNDIVEALESLGSDIETVSSTPTEAPIPESTQATIDELLQSSESLYGKIGELTSMLLDEARSRGADIVDMQTKIQDANHSIARQIKMITASLNTNAAGVLELRGAMVTLKNAMSESAMVLSARFSESSASFTEQIKVVADAQSATSSQVTTLSTTVSGHTTSISQNTSSINGLQGKWGVTINSGGYVTGIELLGGASYGAFRVNADFVVYNVKSSATGARIEISPTLNNLYCYDSSNQVIAAIGDSTGLGGLGSGIVAGLGTSFVGVWGQASGSDGVYGRSTSTASARAGVTGVSVNGNGVQGHTSAATSDSGVVGGNDAGSLGALGFSSWDVYAAGSGTNYGPFTGAHDALLPLDITLTEGMIVCDDRCISKRNISNTIWSIRYSDAPNQNAIGVLSSQNGILANNRPSAFIKDIKRNVTDEGMEYTEIVMNEVYEEVKNDYNYCTMNAVGEGQVLVCGENGDIGKGDLIVTSSMSGVGMRQDDDVIRSTTVAKAREPFSFSSPGESRLIACIYMCG